MRNEKFIEDRFSVQPERPDTDPDISAEGIVTGEIERVEPSEAEVRLKLMSEIENAARKDVMLAKAFDEITDADPRLRAENLLDRINALRRELDTSDVDPAFKSNRARRLSDIANRLRGLL